MNKRLYGLDLFNFLCSITVLIAHANLIGLRPSGMLGISIGVSFFLFYLVLHSQYKKDISITEKLTARFLNNSREGAYRSTN